jgi:DNA modification methylase
MSASLRRLLSDIKSLIRAADRLDAQTVELDIRARWHEAQAGYRWALSRDRIIKKECEERGINEEEWCKQELDCDIATMRRRVQLYRNWHEYVEKRRAEGHTEQWGLRYGLSLIPSNRRYATDSRPGRVRSASNSSRTDPKLDLSRCEFITGDALEMLKSIPSNSNQCIITSPPFWPMRRTFGGVGIGFEKTLKEYIANLLAVFRECMRVLHKDGVLWLHLEDSYSYSGGHWRPNSYLGRRQTDQSRIMRGGLHLPSTTLIRPAKSLLMIPALVVLAMQDEGWLLRSKVIWDKGFTRPDSAKDRPTVTHGELFLFSKAARYTYDPDPIRVPYVGPPERRLGSLPGTQKRGVIRRDVARDMFVYANPLGRNSGTVWRCNVANYQGAHPATFPPNLVRPMILASCTSAVDTVLDPFGGAGTVALVALQLGFKATTIEIFPDYTAEAQNRLANAPARYNETDEPDADDQQLAAD